MTMDVLSDVSLIGSAALYLAAFGFFVIWRWFRVAKVEGQKRFWFGRLLAAFVAVPIIAVLPMGLNLEALRLYDLQTMTEVDAVYVRVKDPPSGPGFYQTGHITRLPHNVNIIETFIMVRFSFEGKEIEKEVTHSTLDFPLGEPGQRMKLRFNPDKVRSEDSRVWNRNAYQLLTEQGVYDATGQLFLHGILGCGGIILLAYLTRWWVFR
jgi:hypothetical protein